MTWGVVVLAISAVSISTATQASSAENIDVEAKMTEVLTSLKRVPSNYVEESKHTTLTSNTSFKNQLSNTPLESVKKEPAKYGPVKDSYIVTFKSPEKGKSRFIKRPDKAFKNLPPVPFGQHSNGQRPSDIAKALKLNGEVTAIFDMINAVHIKMSAKEARRLARDKRVLRVDQNQYLQAMNTYQGNPGWGLDVIDSLNVTTNNTYDYVNTGAGRTIYILDSGLDLSIPAVANEFGGRASVLYDVNGLDGKDCNGHGTMVASAAAGSTYGVAKGATVVVGKVTTGCGGTSDIYTAVNAPAGSIINYSRGLRHLDPDGPAGPLLPPCFPALYNPALENSIKAAHNAGLIVVVAAGNDSCNTAHFSPVNIPEAFVVGSTGQRVGEFTLFADRKTDFSRTGTNISGFAPGYHVALMNQTGNFARAYGTSFSAPYVAGVFAVACEAAGTLCNSGNTAALYNALRNVSPTGVIRNTDGSVMTGTTSRFISQQW